MTHRSRLTVLLAAAAMALASRAAGSSGWNIEESRAPERIPVDFVVEEGTWMSLDVAPDGRFLYGVAMHDGTKNTVYQFGFNGDRVVLIPAPEASASRPGAGFRPINYFRDDPERGLIFYEQVDGALYAAGGSIGTYDKRTGETRHYIRRPGGALAPALKDYITPHRAARHQLATAARVHPGPEPAGGFYFLKGSG